MDHPAAERFVRSLYQHMLERAPGAEEFDRWMERASVAAPDEIFHSFVASKEYQKILAKRTAGGRVKLRYPPGHFYSPIVDPAEAAKYVRCAERVTDLSIVDLPGIVIDNERMVEFWSEAAECIRTTTFSAPGASTDRYYWPNPSYPMGDALVLRAMICCRRPRRVIEIGCGFSSASMLDAADQVGLEPFSMTCIDPYPERLRSLLRPQDQARVRIIDKPVQEVPPEVFSGLESGDFLFIDSTHVLKTGSDVCHELFSVLPTLAPGVLVHFHDCRYPFEYPARWIFERNYSWNEIYALHAFLMFNSEYEIVFWNTFFALANRSLAKAIAPAFAWNPGGGLWIWRKPAAHPLPPPPP